MDNLLYKYVIDVSAPEPDDDLLHPFLTSLNRSDWQFTVDSDSITMHFRKQEDRDDFAQLVQQMKGPLN